MLYFKKQHFPFLLALIFLFLASAYIVVVAWVEPTALPPGGNVDPPINTGGSAQSKAASIAASAFYDNPNTAYYLDPEGGLGVSAVLGGGVSIGTTAAPDAKIMINEANVDGVKLLGFSENNSDNFYFESGFAGALAAGNYLKFRTLWTDNVLVIRGDGNVGVGGVPNALRKLDVEGAAEASSLCIQGDSCITQWSDISGGNPAGGTGAVQFNLDGTNFGGDATNLYWDNSNKRLGIGTGATAPLSALTVNGGITVGNPTTIIPQISGDAVAPNITRLFIQPSSGNQNMNAFFLPSGSSVSSSFQIRNSSNLSNYGRLIAMIDGAAIELAGNSVGAGVLPTSLAIGLGALGSIDDLVISSTGNVGIGDSAPSYKLDVAGDIRSTNRLISGSLAADPAGVNGAMYYNTATNKFRCYENGAWANCVGGGGLGLSDAFTEVRNSAGTLQFSASGADQLRFAGGTGSNVSFTPASNLVTFSADFSDVQRTITGNCLGAAPGQVMVGVDALGNVICEADDVGVVGGGVTTVGSMTAATVFADVNADNDWLGLGAAAGRIEFDDNLMVLDEVNILSARVGISDNSPDALLDILQMGVNEPAFRVDDDFDGDATPFIIEADGDVGIGEDTPSAKLDVVGNVEITGQTTISSSLSAGSLSVGGNASINGTLNMNNNQIQNMRIENRTTNPGGPSVGRIWICTDNDGTPYDCIAN